jgi:hypothetical protein
MKGFETSTDYQLLWDLIQDGYRIPAWIVYSDEYKEPILDLVEVKSREKGHYMIGTRGRGYEGINDGIEGLKTACSHIKLKFIKPQL